MKRSFKKAIAVLLAALMAAFSVPFSAFATQGDDFPDIDLMFGTFHTAQATSWTDYTVGNGNSDFSLCGLYDVPVDMDFTIKDGGLTKSGTLYIDKDKANTTIDSLESIGAPNGYDKLTENYTLGVGDYFTCTMIENNAEYIGAQMACISISDNIEPAGYYTYKSGRQTYHLMGTVTDAEAVGGTFSVGGLLPVDQYPMGSTGIYGMNTGATGNATEIETDTNGVTFMKDCESDQTGKGGMDLSRVTNTEISSLLVNPNTGDAANGYDYQGTAILQTFVFKITGEGPIEFSVYDPHNTVRRVFEGGYLVAKATDGVLNRQYTTYAYNDVDTNGNPTGVENPGSRNMTYFGMNVNGKNGDPYPPETPTECTHTNLTAVAAKEATCTEAGNEAYWTCPDCSKMFSDASASTEITEIPTINAKGHTMTAHAEVKASCGVEGTGAYWTCDTCGKMFSDADGATEIAEIPVLPALEHNYVVTEDTTSSCTQAGHTTYVCSNCDDTYTTDKALAAHSIASVAEVASTCTQAGVGAHYQCSVCNAIFSDAEGNTPTTLEELALPLADHTFGSWTSDGKGNHTRTCTECNTETETQACSYTYEIVTPATELTEGLGRYTCTVCDYSYDEVIPKQDCTHATTHIENEVDATCTTAGYTGDKVCDVCGNKVETGTEIPAKGHTMTAHDKVDATCTSTGTEAYWTCSACDKMFADANGDVEIDAPVEIAAKGHTLTAHDKVDASCTSTGTEAYWTCDTCSKMFADANGATEIDAPVVIDKTAHTPVLDETTAVDPTIDKEGKEADTVCSVCHTTLETGAVIPMLESVVIEVAKTDLGTTTLNGVDSTNGLATKVEKNSTVTLSATPVEGAEFVGWALNGKVVSNAADCTVKALSNAAYTPVFTETAADTFTVVFVDNFGNVISTQTVASATDIAAPTAPVRPGYTFSGWSVDYTALTQGATVYAMYEKDAAATYTVTATGCTITTTDGASATDSLADLPFDTMVTVTPNDGTAASWKIGDATVAFGESYTFYVGSDVTVVPQFDGAVTAVPTVSALSTSDVTLANGMKKAVFLATRSMTDDCTFISAGYIYGKSENVTAATKINDVNGTTVKRIDASSGAEQFGVTYGLSAQSGAVTGIAYLAYVDADGNIQTIYAEPQTYTYA